ncbi:MAG: CHASE2 domain-containing protein, partial [Cyanobacteria bacterium P01_G01_bin.38]
ELSDDQLIAQVGFSNLLLDSPSDASTGDFVRRQALSYAPELAATQSTCSTPYSLSFQLAYYFLSQAGIAPLAVIDNQWQFGSVVLPPLTRRFGGYQNLDGLSAQLMLNYRTGQPGQRVSLQTVLSGQIEADQVKDRLILVGHTAPVARDTVDTPQGKMAGVWVHAHMVSQLLSAVLDQRPLIRVLPQWRSLQWGDGLWILTWSLIGGGVSSWWVSRQVQTFRWLLLWALALAVIGGGLSYLSLIAITQGLWLPLMPTLLSVLLTGGLVVLKGISKYRL